MDVCMHIAGVYCNNCRPKVCPTCGTCPTCGHHAAPAWQPGYQPYFQPYPGQTMWISTITTSGGTTVTPNDGYRFSS